jgi:hypothetical protein
VYYYLGLLSDAEGDPDAATLEFLRCRDLDSATPRQHWSLTAAQFERHVRKAIERLEPGHQETLDGALVVVTELPGAEVVADGVDPRAAVLLDALGERDGRPHASRVFVYQRNVERLCESAAKLEDDLLRLVKTEIEASFPGLAKSEE